MPRMQAWDKAKAEGIENPADHVKKMNLRGYYRCCFYKWKKARAAQQWSLICLNSPRLAKSYKELPNTVRTVLGLGKKFDHRKAKGGDENTTTILPRAFQDAVSELVVSCCVLKIGGGLCANVCKN